MEVLMLTYNDWANTSWRFSKCLQLLGIDVKLYKGRKHAFGYPEQAEIHPLIAEKELKNRYPVMVDVPELKSLSKKAKIIHFTASTLVNTGINLKKKFVVVQHGGSTYRLKPKQTNAVFNPFVDHTIIQCPDLLNLGAKKEILIYYPVDTEFIQPHFDRQDKEKLLIGHFPSRPQAKGTKSIVEVLNKLKSDSSVKDKFEYIGSTKNVKWKHQLKRVAKCDILIETLNLKFEGKTFGEWGNQAIEAASLGKIVITNSLTPDIYKREYGQCELNIVNNKDNLESKLRDLFSMSDDKILEKKKKTRAWVVKNHSMKANALRLWEKVYCNFFDGERKKAIEMRVKELEMEIKKEIGDEYTNYKS
jgi:hypothetical protein